MQLKNEETFSTLHELQEQISAAFKELPEEAFESVPEETLKALYYVAYNYYQNGKYDQAEHFFRLLTCYDTFDMSYWMGLAAARQKQKKYEQAIEAYCAARLLAKDNRDAEPSIQLAICYFALKQKEDGLQALDAAASSGKQSGNAKVLDQVALLRSIWSNDNLNR